MAVRAYGIATTTHPTWEANSPYSLLDYIIPSTPNGFCYECTNAGTSGTDEPTWVTTPGQTVLDGYDPGEGKPLEDPITWTCRELLWPNPLVVELDTEGFGGYSLKDIWVRNDGEAEFIVYGSYDGDNWRQIDEINTPQGNRDNRHKGLQNAYRFTRVVVDSEVESEIEIVAGSS